MTITSTRRSVLAGLPFLASGSTTERLRATARPRLAITIDDFDLSDATMLDPEERDRRIRSSLTKHGIRAAGFVAGKYVEDRRGRRVLQAWSNDGHLLGNHSYSHNKFTGERPDVFMADILRCEAILANYSGFRKFFRFPYLAEGTNARDRDEMRRLLKLRGYRNGHVTIDTSDWFIDGRLRARLQSAQSTKITEFRKFYLSHIWDRATYYDSLARRVFGHPICHSLLLHHRLTTALFLDDTIEMFRTRGWQVVDAAVPFASPEFTIEPNSLPAGQSLVWAAAKASGRFEAELRLPGEDGAYEEPKMATLGL